MSEGRVIAIVGAESTGKTQLARSLAEALAAAGWRATWVSEHLREWCDEQRRTPRRDEQAAIARTQTERIAAAAASHAVVVADTTALMTAVYSRIVFGDDSLDAWAAQAHRSCDLTLLTAIDLPWVADGHQRDGPQVREPVDTALRTLMLAHELPWSVVSGRGPHRLQHALQACERALAGTNAGGGLFTRLRAGNADAAAWQCAGCDDPGCEQRLRSRSSSRRY